MNDGDDFLPVPWLYEIELLSLQQERQKVAPRFLGHRDGADIADPTATTTLVPLTANFLPLGDFGLSWQTQKNRSDLLIDVVSRELSEVAIDRYGQDR